MVSGIETGPSNVSDSVRRLNMEWDQDITSLQLHTHLSSMLCALKAPHCLTEFCLQLDSQIPLLQDGN